MSSIRLHPHPSLPAPVVHAGFSSPQSKSHVLAGVQDAYWSDDEAEDAECPLCLEEMDISDLNFKPCICGYQICRFCWHHIKENLNGRCPACRRVYTDEAVQFKPIAKEDHKRLTQQKKQRERERKDLEALGRRHLANVRVVQRNVVYVVGIGPRFAKEELIPTLRSNEYFGQYGKITKILLVKRTPSSGGAPVVGLYITYHRREDAARAIAAVDGTVSPGGGREVMRASYGTTKYCMTFLRSTTCSDHGCMNLHEWGDEKDCFTKEDLTTLKHTMKDTESRSRVTTAKKGEEADGLPRAASWAQKGVPSASQIIHSSSHNANFPPPSASSRQSRRTGTTARQQRPVPPTTVSSNVNGRKAAGKTPSQASSSRPSTPAAQLPQRPTTPAEAKLRKAKETRVPPSRSSTPSIAVDSDIGSGSQDVAPSPPATRPQSVESVQSPPPIPPGLPAIPPGLSAPPGLPAPIRLSRTETALPQTPLLAAQSSYQMSTAARALVDDVKARREAPLPTAQVSPFPDFDRTLQTLAGANNEFGGFSFNLDPKLAGDEADDALVLPDFNAESSIPFRGNFMDAFPALKSTNPQGFMPPPGLGYLHDPNRSIYEPMTARSSVSSLDKPGGSNYTGSFNPFADQAEKHGATPDSTPRKPPLDDDSSRKVSRFGFARGRQGSNVASSPAHVASPLGISNSNSDLHISFYNSSDNAATTSAPPPWSVHPRQPLETYSPLGSSMNSPIMQHAQAQPYTQPSGRFQPFDTGVSEAQLRELIQSSRTRTSSNSVHNTPAEVQASQLKSSQSQSFQDPAIMSARLASPAMTGNQEGAYGSPLSMMESPQSMSYGAPPGLSYPPGISPTPSRNGLSNPDTPQSNGSLHVSTSNSPVSSPHLSSSDFPALTAEPTARRAEHPAPPIDSPVTPDDAESQAKVERKAAKKAAAAERAAERQKVAQEKAAAKAAEKAKLAAEKAAEKEKALALKAEQEKAVKEKAERDKAAKNRLAQEKAAQLEKARLAQVEKEKERAAAQAKKAAAKTKQTDGQKSAKPSPTPAAPSRQSAPKQTPSTTESTTQVPILSKMPKKNKPVTKPIRIPTKEDDIAQEEMSAFPPASASEASQIPLAHEASTVQSSSTNSRAESIERGPPEEPISIADFFEDIDIQHPHMDLPNHPFFDLSKINPAAKMPLEYGPLVHALSALSVGGGSFANNMPSGSIDNAVSSFQQLLETLTQTISDLLRLLPRTTWDDSSSFDGVLRDMLKGDDFLDDGGEDGPGKEDEVAALTLALERRARWMEVQLSKLEELHRDINTAAVRAVLSFNDNGWDRGSFMPRMGNTLRRFDNIGVADTSGKTRPMSADELEEKLVVAKEAMIFAEVELRESMEKMQEYKPFEVDMMF